ncbi:MAG: hypothetical protein JXQ23_12295, partial [Clostridia bacterium]|nr:hypothetical protein [Clostridia bacterium]
PEYPKNYEQTLKVISQIKQMAEEEISDIDLLVLPEYSNCAGMSDMEEIKSHIEKHNEDYLFTLISAAKNNHTHIAVNMVIREDSDYFNATVFITNQGEIKAIYKKTHLAYPEKYSMGLKEGNEAIIIEVDKVRYSFATCFELYFSEYFEYLASLTPDIILVPSYQRSEDSRVLEIQVNQRALDCECFIIRASYSMGEESQKGGFSQISSPEGMAILKAEQKTGLFVTDLNPVQKRLRPLAHGLAKLSSREIIESFRRPELYRQGGHLVRNIHQYTYPRICAHRGFSHACPENTIPAFLAAIAAGADEIEFDLRVTKDGHIVVCHDVSIDRTTTGKGNIADLTLDEIRKEDAGVYLSEEWKGVRMPTLDEVFESCAGLIMMNIHIYDPGEDGSVVKKISELSKLYHVDHMIYLAGEKKVLEYSLRYAPHLERACLEAQQSEEILYYAKLYQCQRLQFFRNVSDDMIRKAKELGMICNLFYADDEIEAEEYIRRGIDTILTNKASKMVWFLKNK